jgi:RNA polymerase sigma-70 factor (ECF subfamily)
MRQPLLPSASSDSALIERLRAGDGSAFAGLIDQYQGSMLRLAQVFVSSRATAEEVVQDAWLGVLQGLSAFEGRSSLKTWIFRILVNRAKTRGGRDARAPVAAFDQEPDTPSVDPARFQANGHWSAPLQPWDDRSPERALATKRALQHLEVAIASLPASQRAVVTLRDIEGLDTDNVCNILEISETHQRVLLHRARSALRAALEGHMG